MLRNTKKEGTNGKTATAMSTASPGGHNSLVQGTLVEGTIKSENDFRVDGTIKGNLHCKSKVIIGPSGKVEGEIKCSNAVIEGHFEGQIEVTDLLNIRKTAKVSGEVKTNKLIVEPGGIFNVSCIMGGGGLSAAAKSNSGPATSTTQKDKEQLARSAQKA